jgi:hypothetical protein
LEGLPYLILEPAQAWVPRLGTLDFLGTYVNRTEDPFTVDVAFEAFLPGASEPKKVFSNPLTLDPGSSTTRFYVLTVPGGAPKKPGYLLKVKMYDPDGSGVVISQNRFEVKPTMESVPFE